MASESLPRLFMFARHSVCNTREILHKRRLVGLTRYKQSKLFNKHGHFQTQSRFGSIRNTLHASSIRDTGIGLITTKTIKYKEDNSK